MHDLAATRFNTICQHSTAAGHALKSWALCISWLYSTLEQLLSVAAGLQKVSPSLCGRRLQPFLYCKYSEPHSLDSNASTSVVPCLGTQLPSDLKVSLVHSCA